MHQVDMNTLWATQFLWYHQRNLNYAHIFRHVPETHFLFLVCVHSCRCAVLVVLVYKNLEWWARTFVPLPNDRQEISYRLDLDH